MTAQRKQTLQASRNRSRPPQVQNLNLLRPPRGGVYKREVSAHLSVCCATIMSQLPLVSSQKKPTIDTRLRLAARKQPACPDALATFPSGSAPSGVSEDAVSAVIEPETSEWNRKSAAAEGAVGVAADGHTPLPRVRGRIRGSINWPAGRHHTGGDEGISPASSNVGDRVERKRGFSLHHPQPRSEDGATHGARRPSLGGRHLAHQPSTLEEQLKQLKQVPVLKNREVHRNLTKLHRIDFEEHVPWWVPAPLP